MNIQENLTNALLRQLIDNTHPASRRPPNWSRTPILALTIQSVTTQSLSIQQRTLNISPVGEQN